MFFVGKVNNANRMPPPLHLYTLAAELRHALNVRQPRSITIDYNRDLCNEKSIDEFAQIFKNISRILG